MAVGKNVESRGHILGFKEEIDKAAQQSADCFASWFNNDESEDSAFLKGRWDFSYHIALPLMPYVYHPHNVEALEIGCGGGRLLGAASGYFGNIAGIDIHNNLPYVEQRLNGRGVCNLSLRQTDGNCIPFEDDRFDVVYSFIVLQHVEKIAILEKYISETLRVLKTDGVAILYFGRFCRFSGRKKSLARLYLDRFFEIFLPRGYRELSARVNETNLIVTRRFVENIVRSEGGVPLEWRVSRKNIPDGYEYYGGQHGLVFKKKSKVKESKTD